VTQNNNKIISGLAVELYLDADAEKKVLEFREQIYQAGVQPVLGLLNDKPHVSLAVIPTREAGEIIRLTSEFSNEISRISFHLGAVGIFPTPDNVLFVYPSPSKELLEAHRKFHEKLSKAGITSSRYYDPGKWVPHLTLEFNLADDDLSLAIRIAQKLFTPISGEFTQLGVVAFRPIEYLDHFELKEKK
jgi:2'-5' RNA ligase